MSADPEAPQVNAGDTPAPAVEDGTQQPETTQVNWEERYANLQPEYTRATQEAARYRQLVDDLRASDPDTRLQAAQALGLELVAEEEDTPDIQYQDDPTAALKAELDQIKQSLTQRDQQAAEAQRLEHIETHVEQQLNGIDGLGNAEKDWIVNRAVHLPPTPDGMPDIQAAHKEFEALMDQQMKKWASQKRQAPYVSPNGTAGTEVLPLDATHAQRARYMAEKLMADNAM